MSKAIVRTLTIASLLGAGFVTGYAVAQQAHLKAAIDALNSAENHLKVHKPDVGGHAAEAIKAIGTAKSHVELATKAK